jgi:SAM-dependent methyltransferase
MEVLDSGPLGTRRLIISPPTDAGLSLLVDANTGGETELLCFSGRTEQIAAAYCRRRQINTLVTRVEPFFRIPDPDQFLSAVYANCLFDFCAETHFDSMLAEIWRVLEPGGVLFAVYMDHPTHFGGRVWASVFDRFSFLSNGCYPVSIVPTLARLGFQILRDMPADKFGFPLRYVVSVRPAQSS